MDINVTHFKKQVSKRHIQKDYVAKPLGSILKYHRKLLKMTLEEAAEGICSISYISKIENNLIECGETYLGLFKQRYQIKDVVLPEDEVLRDLYQVECWILYDQYLEDDYELRYAESNDYRSLFIRFSYALQQKEYKKAGKYYKAVLQFMSQFSEHEYALICIMISKHLYLEGAYMDGHQVITLAPEEKALTPLMSLYLLKYRLLHAFKMKCESEIRWYYPRFHKEAIRLEAYTMHKEIQRHYLYYEAEFIHPEIMLKKIEESHFLLPKERNYLLALSAYYHHQYSAAIDHIKAFAHQDLDALIIYMISVDKLNKHEAIHELPHRTELIHKSREAALLYRHLKLKSTYQKEDILNYLRTHILGIGMITYHYHILEYLMMDSQHLFARYQFYKEANQVIHEIHPKLKSLKKAQQRLILET